MTFGKKNKNQIEAGCDNAVQTHRKEHPYGSLLSDFHGGKSEMRLYKTVRDAVPVISAAIDKLARLIGTFNVVCADSEAEAALSHFLENVRVGSSSAGISSFIDTYFKELLTCGTAVGEIVSDGEDITALYIADFEDIELGLSKGGLETIVSVSDGVGGFTPVRYPQLLLLSTIGQKPSSPYGTSILKGLPFIADILLTVFNTTGVNWERCGNIRYAVTYKPQNDTADKSFARQRAKQVAEQWAKTMQSSGPVRDFVAVGDVEIKVIGAESSIPDSEIPVRQMLEQIVAKLGVPPFLLGLNWTSTERMSALQADILTSEIDAYREILCPVIKKICSLWLRLNGYEDDFEIEWSNVTLQDSLLLAQADYYTAQAENLRKEEENGKE